MKNSYINKIGQVIQPKDLEKTADEINALKKVVANPTLAGTEAELTGIEIGGTKYKAGGGSGTQLYRHYIHILYGQYYGMIIIIISLDNEPITQATLSTVLQSRNIIRLFGDSGENMVLRFDTQTNEIKVYYQYLFNSDEDASFKLGNVVEMSGITSFTDTVTAL